MDCQIFLQIIEGATALHHLPPPNKKHKTIPLEQKMICILLKNIKWMRIDNLIDIYWYLFIKALTIFHLLKLKNRKHFKCIFVSEMEFMFSSSEGFNELINLRGGVSSLIKGWCQLFN